MSTEPTNIADLRKQSKLPAKQAGGQLVEQFFKQNLATLKTLLPSHMKPERMLKIALGALRTTPKLMECTTESLFGAVVQCSQLGLEPNTPLGHAYLIPFKNNKANRMDVQVIFGYRGLVDLARRSGQIVSIAAHAVHELDKFSYEYGLDEHLKHIPASGARGNVTYFYAVAKLVGGGHAFEVMSRADVEKIRDASQNWKTAQRLGKTAESVWTMHFEEMGRKTLIRRLFKYLPVSIEMATASALDGQAASGEAQNMGDVLTGEYTVLSDDDPLTDGAEGEPAAGTGQQDSWPKRVHDKWIDSAGEEHDPAKHATSSDGAPGMNQDGTFRARRGSKAGTKQQSEPASQGATPTLKEVISRLERAATQDELDEAYDLGRSLSEDDRDQIDNVYNLREQHLKQQEPGDGFGME